MGSMFERDYIRRMIQQLARFVARVLKLKQEKRYDEALQELEAAFRLVLGDRDWLRQLDAGSVARILGDVQHIKAYAALEREAGEIAALKCDVEQARLNYLRARDLYLEALTLAGDDLETASALRFLLEQLESTGVAFNLEKV